MRVESRVRAWALTTLVVGCLPRPVSGQAFERPYPERILTVETARFAGGDHGQVGLGETRVGPIDGFEILTNTLGDVIGIANGGVKARIVEEARGGPALAIGARYYHSYGGLIDTGVRRIAASFSDVTDSQVRVSGLVFFGTASWTISQRTHAHAALQGHHPIETEFEVEDSTAGGGGRIAFVQGNDVSALAAVDHAVTGTGLLLLGEAGWSFGLERPRLGLGLDAGSRRVRVVVGVLVPGVKTDLATDARDFHVTPTFSLHARF